MVSFCSSVPNFLFSDIVKLTMVGKFTPRELADATNQVSLPHGLLNISSVLHNNSQIKSGPIRNSFLHCIQIVQSCGGIQPFGVPGLHWKKSCLGPHINYIATCNHKENLIMFEVNL